jgi:rod shape-determining protein MreC
VLVVPQFFSNKKLIILLVSIIFLVALIGFSMRDREKLTMPEQFVMDVVGWTQTVFYKPANTIAGFFENVSDLKEVYEENKILKARLDEYADLAVAVKDLKEENESLRATLDKTESMRDFTIRHATVIARTPEAWYQEIYINKGELAGIRKDMAVISPQGFIGKIDKVSKFHSTVELISDGDPNNRISAIIKTKDQDIFGTIEGYDSNSKVLLFKIMSENKDLKIEKNDTVVTSGMGGVFPPGLIIGEVIEVVPDEVDLTKIAYIKPAANLYEISDVMVLERTAQTIDPESEKSEGTE